MRNWKTKLTSRKFWAAICGVVLSVMVMLGSSEEEQNKTVALITASVTLIAYIPMWMIQLQYTQKEYRKEVKRYERLENKADKSQVLDD